MIYTCWFCGWRINQRKPGEADNPNIGKHLLFDHHAFCSKYCINSYKCKKNKKPESPQDWGFIQWKKEHKTKVV